MEAGSVAQSGQPMMGIDINGKAQFMSAAGVPGTPVSKSSGDVAAASAVAALPAAVGKRTYITGFEVTGGGATAASVIQVTVAGVLGGTLTYNFAVPAGAAVGATPLFVEFPQPLPASADNTAITVTAPSFGAGNAHASVNAHGFQL